MLRRLARGQIRRDRVGPGPDLVPVPEVAVGAFTALTIIRSAKPSLLLSSAPKKRRCSTGPTIPSISSSWRLRFLVLHVLTERPAAEEPHGRSASGSANRWTNSTASFIQEPA